MGSYRSRFIIAWVRASASSGTRRYRVARLTPRTWATSVTGVFSPLMVLWQHRTGTVSELAQHLDLPAHAMTPLLQRLEQAGLIVRRRSPIDSRAVLIELTSVGVELETSAAAVQRTVKCATGLSPETLAALRGELHHLVDDMRATAAGPHAMEGQAS